MPSKREGAGLFGYLKNAFLYHWNLLFFVGGVAAAVVSPLAAALLPLIGAAEIAYLAGMVGSPRFRRAIDAKEAGISPRPLVVDPHSSGPERLQALVAGLSRTARDRFDALRSRALQMRTIASGVGGSARGRRTQDELQAPALDRLLWVFLRLLYSQTALGQFLAATDEDQIALQVDRIREKLARAKARQDERLERSLTDSLATSELRLDNYRRATQNAEFVDVELDRLEGKIHALSEMSVSRQDPDYISREVDSVAASMHHTEEAISELALVDGLIDDLGQPPSILEADLKKVLDHER